jgi:hypothetical protein
MWYTLAYLVLTSPTEPEIPSRLAESESFRTTLQTLAVRWEIMDPREVRWVLTRPEDFLADLRMLRRRYAELADAPLALDAWRFPDRETVNACLTFNRAYRENVESNWSPGRAYEMTQALAEVDRLYSIWDNVRDSQMEYYYVTVRRSALKQLREAVGAEAYTRGELPCHVPLHRFRMVD